MLFNYHTIIELGIFSALLSLFLEFCFRDQNIFSGWLDWWADWWLSRNDPQKLELVNKMDDEDVIELTDGDYDKARDYKFSLVHWWWFKPLGYCVVCMNVWVSLLLCSIPFVLLFMSPIELLCTVLLSNFLVRYFYKKLL